MTFVVNEDGVVYQKDLGKKTEVLAKAEGLQPQFHLAKMEEQQEEIAGEQKTK